MYAESMHFLVFGVSRMTWFFSFQVFISCGFRVSTEYVGCVFEGVHTDICF